MPALQHHILGTVNVTVRQNTSRVSARWKSGMVNVNIPSGLRASRLSEILDTMAPRLLASRPEVTYFPGQELRLPYFTVVIRSQSLLPDKILMKAATPVSAIEVGTNLDWDSPSTSRAISAMLCRIAHKVAPDTLIPRARQLAAEVRRAPGGWIVSTGHRILGQCSSNGIISLSHVLMFLPQELSDYVIYHELAHLSEMNHSPRFHALLNSYLHGREDELRRRLKAFSWPVLRK